MPQTGPGGLPLALRLSEGLGCTLRAKGESLGPSMAEGFCGRNNVLCATAGLILVRAPGRSPSAKGMGALAPMLLPVCPWHRRCATAQGRRTPQLALLEAVILAVWVRGEHSRFILQTHIWRLTASYLLAVARTVEIGATRTCRPWRPEQTDYAPQRAARSAYN